MKKKFYAVALMLCMVIISFFSGCTLVSRDVNAEREQDVFVVGERSITTNEIINSFYSYYEQYQYYFMYSDTAEVMDSFYNSLISREVVLEEAQKLFDSQVITLTNDDYTKVWEDVFDYFHEQVDTYEKNLLKHNKVSEDLDTYPSRLKEEEDKDKEAEIKYEEYTFEEVTAYVAGTQGTLEKVSAKLDELSTFVKTKYIEDLEAEDRTVLDIVNTELTLRAKAFDKYIASLMLAAKANGEAYDKLTAYTKEVQRVLDAYVESALYEEYKEYVNSLIISDDYKKLNKEAVVNRYVELLGKDSEKYETYANYTKVLSTSNNESLILYHNGSESKYFSVQHILVKFDDDTVAKLKQEPGYSTSMDIALREQYENEVRKGYADTLQTKEFLKPRNAGTGLTIAAKANGYSAEDVVTLYYDLINDASVTTAAQKAQIFNKLSWEFSQDTGSLVNELSNVVGFAISSENYEHGTLAKDFTNGARRLYEAYVSNPVIGEDVELVVSDFGIHIMMLTGVYDTGAVADVVYKTEAGKEVVDIDATFAKMNAAKVSNLTNQSIYEYIYDQLKESLIGDKNTFFTEFTNTKTAEYREDGKIKENKERPSYDELMDALR